MRSATPPRRLPPAVIGLLVVLALALMTIQYRHLALVRDAAHLAERGHVAGCEARVASCRAWLDGPGRILEPFGRDCRIDCRRSP